MLKAAKLAAWFFCQPCGGSAVQGFAYANELRADGCAQVEARYDEIVSYWTDWCPVCNGTPKSILGTLPFSDPIKITAFPTGSAEWRNFILTGSGYQAFLHLSEFHFLPERSQPCIPRMPPAGQTLRQFGQKIAIDQHVQYAISDIGDSSQSAFLSPVGTAGQVVWRASEAQSAVGQTEKLLVEVEVAVPTADSAGSAAQGPGSAGAAVGPGTA
eukprot:4720323-Pyramimonas_sp.AAC.1